MTPITSFSYGGSTVTMDVNPLHPRTWNEEKKLSQGHDSEGDGYTYDSGTPTIRTEALTFPAISRLNLDRLCGFVEGVIYGRQHIFTWTDRLGVTRQARYAGMSHQQVSPLYYRVVFTIEVLT